MNYSYPDFVRYCEIANSSIAADSDILWYNNIPVPNGLMKDVFSSSSYYFRIYAEHLYSGVILSLAVLRKQLSEQDFNSLPNPDMIMADKARFSDIWRQAQELDFFKAFEAEFSNGLLKYPYEIDLDCFLQTISHKGKKYERLYLPEFAVETISISMPKIRQFLKNKNGDFFGNIIAENLKIYKAGFSDAFSGFFNRLLDFKLHNNFHVDPRIAINGLVATASNTKVGAIIPEKPRAGNFWEPTLTQGGSISVKVDSNSPFFELSENEQVKTLLLALSNEEMMIFNDKTKDLLEDFRQRVSMTIKHISYEMLKRDDADQS